LSILKFEEIVELWQHSSCSTSILELLGLVASSQNNCAASAFYTLEELYERFRGTWWEVIWPVDRNSGRLINGVQCKYVADSLPDALRNHPMENFPNVDAQQILYACSLDDEADDIEINEYSHHFVTY
jgi:hypothetical protein